MRLRTILLAATRSDINPSSPRLVNWQSGCPIGTVVYQRSVDAATLTYRDCIHPSQLTSLYGTRNTDCRLTMSTEVWTSPGNGRAIESSNPVQNFEPVCTLSAPLLHGITVTGNSCQPKSVVISRLAPTFIATDVGKVEKNIAYEAFYVNQCLSARMRVR